MKRPFLYMLFGCLSLTCIMGCDNAEYPALDNAIYLVDAGNRDSYDCIDARLSDRQFNVTLRMTSPLEHPVKVSLAVDEQALSDHNAKFDDALQVLPTENWAFVDSDGKEVDGSLEVTIPAGRNTVVFPVQLKSVAEDDMTQYALPLSIASVSEDITVLEKQKTVLYAFQKDFEVPVLIVKANNDIVWRWEKNDFPATNTWTVEFFFTLNRMKNDTAYGNETLWVNGNSSSLYVRPYANADGMDIHLHGSFDAGGFSVEKGTWSDSANDGRWHHFAYVCNNDKVTSYLDGVEMKSVVNPLWQEPTKFDGFNFASTHHPSPIGYSELRIWSVARSAGDIKRSKYKVNPNSKGLFAYYKLDEGEGSVFHDATGNGHDLDENSFSMINDDANTKYENITSVFKWGKAKNDEEMTAMVTTDGQSLLNVKN